MRQKLQRYIHKYWHFLALGALSILYLALQYNRFFNILEYAYIDDALQYDLSKNISEGKWLGGYNRLTLIKGVGFPVWGALLHITHIPLWLGNGLLIIFACLAIFYALRRLGVGRLMLVLVYGLILFNPMVTSRIYRDDIIPALILLVCAWSIGIFACLTKWKSSEPKLFSKDIIGFTIIGSLSLPAWYYTREDATWLMPFILTAVGTAFIYCLYKLRQNTKHSIKPFLTALLLFIVPFLVIYAAGIGIATLNKNHYNRYVINDYYSEEFEQAYAALSRVASDRPQHPTVPISYDMRQKLYRASPAFDALRSCLDGPNGPCEGFKTAGPNKALIDYEGGWLPHALRLAVEKKGYYKDAEVANKYYLQLTSEVNKACDVGNLTCKPLRMVSFLPISRNNIERTLDPELKKSLYFLHTLHRNGGEDSFSPINSPQNKEKDETARYYDARYTAKKLSTFENLQKNANEYIYKFYSFVNPALWYSSIIILFSATIARIRRPSLDWRVILISWLLLATIILRVAMLSYINIASFPTTTSVLYYSAVYPLMFLFEGLSLSLLITFISSVYYRRKS